MSDGLEAFAQLSQTIRQRKEHPSDASYTSSLLDQGMKAIGAKVMEEAREFVSAAHDLDEPPSADRQQSHEHLIHEAADLLYHTMVMLAHYDADLTDVGRELARRFGVSGLDEKASRNQS